MSALAEISKTFPNNVDNATMRTVICIEFYAKNGCFIVEREELKELAKQYDKSENDLKALQSVGQVKP